MICPGCKREISLRNTGTRPSPRDEKTLTENFCLWCGEKILKPEMERMKDDSVD